MNWMMRELGMIFVISTALLPLSCSHYVAAKNPENYSACSEMKTGQKSIDGFWKDFQVALRERDMMEVSRLTKFPLDVGLAEIEGFEGIENREGFERHFESIFPLQAIESILNAKPPTKGKNHSETWSFSHHQPNQASEEEWSIIYSFSVIEDGSIKMTAINFAG